MRLIWYNIAIKLRTVMISLKNRFYILITIIIIGLFSGCGDDSNKSSSNNGTTASTSASSTTSTTPSTTAATETTTAETTTETATQTAPSVTTTKPPYTTQKPQTTTAAPPPPVVVPKVKVPTSPGVEVYSSSTASIDVSNKSQGYFTARYFGSNPKVKVLVQKDGQKYQYNLNSNGTVEVFPFSLGSGTYTVGVYEQISGTSYSVSIQQTISVGISNQFLPFLYPNQQVNFSQNSACVTKAAQICAGKNSDIEKIGAIFTFITSNISYDYAEATAIINGSITSYCPYPDEVLSTRKGICYDYASLFAAMARSQGIPTKLVKGYVGPDGLYHAWNQVYTAQTGWITVEIKINPGFNTLDPTFYSSASNKASVVSHFTNASYYRVYQVF